MIITGIGSRETPNKIMLEMEAIGKYCLENNISVRSGHADGADWAFEKGSQQRCIAYLPWQNFNSNLKSNARIVVVPYDDKYYEITKTFHPNAKALSRGAVLLMNRNSCQVLGLNLDKPTNCIVCWTKDGNDSGGTGQALRIAKFYNIPIFNMFYQDMNTAEKIIAKICKFM